MDTSVFYRLTNGLLGPGRSLDVLPDGSGQLWMGTSDESSGQRWRLVDHGGGKYALQTSYLGECFSLDVVNDGTNTTPCLAPTGGFSGQNWTLTPRPDGTCRLVNDFTGPDSSLGTDAGTDDPVLESPVVIIPRQVSDSPDYGYLYEAPYGVGDVARAPGPASVTLAVTVLQKFGSCYNIKIEYRP